MGRRGGGKKRTQARDFRQPRDNVWRENAPRRGDWQPLDMNNADFEEFYKAQKIVPEGEWDEFMGSLRTTLPTTFRINGSGKFAEDLRTQLETNFLASFTEGPVRVGREEMQPPRPLPWYPRKLAWQMDASRAQLRKLDALTAVHEFMKRENDSGGITRQEAVSMVPPLFLDVQPHHRVLDMCAPPGSKTFQLLEALHAASATPPGLVIANDADAQRCNLLTHQVKRMCSPALIVSNHEAQHFPVIHRSAEGGEAMLFDRILCDVPCSGDGTMRKAPDIWRKWSVSNGNGLHALQLRITLRACALLQVGGRLIYSTCTFNPIEDEAVVAEVLRCTGSSMELVDVSEQLPALKRMPGLRTWRVQDQRLGWVSSWQEASEKKGGLKVDPTMFPDAASDAFPLDRCMRVLPHHGDTGGFFIAVLRKVAPIAARDLQPPSTAHRRVPPASNAAAAAAPRAATAGEPRAVQPQQPEAQAAAAAAAESIPSSDGTTAAVGAGAAAQPSGEDADAAIAAIQLPDAAVVAAPAAAGSEAAEPVSAEAAAAAPAAELEPTDPPAPAPQPAASDVLRQAEGGAAVDVAAAAAGDKPAGGWGTRGGGTRGREGGGGKWAGLDPVVPVTSRDLLNSVAAFYGLGSGESLVGQLVTRNAERETPKRLYMVGPAVAELLSADEREALKVTSVGVKAFERQESKDGSVPCSYRIAQEGLPLLLPHITRQRLTLSSADFMRLLTERSLPLPLAPQPELPAAAPAAAEPAAVAAAADAEMSDAEEPPSAPAVAADAAANGDDAAAPAAAGGAKPEEESAAVAGTKAEGGASQAAAGKGAAAAEPAGQQQQQRKGGPASEKPRGPPIDDEATLAQLANIGNGCCVATLRQEEAESLGLPAGGDAEGAITAAAPLALSCWRGGRSVNILVAKPDCALLAEKLRFAAKRKAAANSPPSPLNPHAPEFTPAASRDASMAGSVAGSVAGSAAGDAPATRDTLLAGAALVAGAATAGKAAGSVDGSDGNAQVADPMEGVTAGVAGTIAAVGNKREKPEAPVSPNSAPPAPKKPSL